jgi:hypothetical protein
MVKINGPEISFADRGLHFGSGNLIFRPVAEGAGNSGPGAIRFKSDPTSWTHM